MRSGRKSIAATACAAIALSSGALPARAQVVPVWTTAPMPQPSRASAPAAVAAPTGLALGPGEVFEVVPLKYADVSEVVGLLTGNSQVRPNDTFTPQEPSFGSSGFQGYYGGGGLPTPPLNPALEPSGPQAEPLGRAVDQVMGIDRRLNAVILKGSPATVAQIKAQIAQLDVPVDSVVLETVFVELTQSGARNVGIDFNNANGEVGSVAYSYVKGDFPGLPNTSKGGAVVANLQAAIYAQIARGEGRIISKPRIAAQSGSTAKIVTGDALPILTSIALSGVNAVQQQVQYVNVGVTLQIAPRVSDDGFVTSHVFAVVSSVTGFSQGYPAISQREASTSATVRDGESFVIGGLTQEADLTQRSKLPGLGDLPLLGLAFQAEHRSRAKTDLYIVITPHVIRGRSPPAPASSPAKPTAPLP